MQHDHITDYEHFDRLPRELREDLRNTTACLSSVGVFRAYQQHGIARTIALIKQADQRILDELHRMDQLNEQRLFRQFKQTRKPK